MTSEERARLEAVGRQMAILAESDEVELRPNATLPPLMEMRRIRFQRSLLDQEEASAVSRARDDGLSWNQVGRALGITGEAARRRHAARAA
jgi:hypothetical protein